MSSEPLLLIPGPIPISDAVQRAACAAPESHVGASFKAAFGRALANLVEVFGADSTHEGFAVAGAGTLAMEAAACNLLDPGERALVVVTGVFGERMSEMLRRRGAEVLQVGATVGDVPPLDDVRDALHRHRPRAVFVTHVDTSTATRCDLRAIAAAAHEVDALVIADGVCAAAAEEVRQAAWGVDLYLTGSQKAIGLPPGLALWVASPRALAARDALQHAPPLSLDWHAWRPVLDAYRGGRSAYFSTPPTTLVRALGVGLRELLDEGMDQVVRRHATTAAALRAGFAAMGLDAVSRAPANTLTALRYPAGADDAALDAIRARGVIVAGGLHPALRGVSFRVGHMGVVTLDPARMRSALDAIGRGLNDVGARLDVDAGLEAFDRSQTGA